MWCEHTGKQLRDSLCECRPSGTQIHQRTRACTHESHALHCLDLQPLICSPLPAAGRRASPSPTLTRHRAQSTTHGPGGRHSASKPTPMIQPTASNDANDPTNTPRLGAEFAAPQNPPCTHSSAVQSFHLSAVALAWAWWRGRPWAPGRQSASHHTAKQQSQRAPMHPKSGTR